MSEIEPAAEPEPQDDVTGASPYRNLMVPLVVVPAMIVMVLVLVFLLFGAIAGEERTPLENTRDMVEGSLNEREQAAFNLVRQALEHRDANASGRAPEHAFDAPVLEELRSARERVEDDELTVRFVIARVLSLFGDVEGVLELIEMTELPPSLDDDGTFRLQSVVALADVGRGLEPAVAQRARVALLELLDQPDEGLELAAVMALSAYAGNGAEEAVRTRLSAASAQMRLNAAVSLAGMGDPTGAEALLELVGVEPYEAERAEHEGRWTRAENVSLARRLALETLDSIERRPDDAALEALASDDADPHVREAARTLLARPR